MRAGPTGRPSPTDDLAGRRGERPGSRAGASGRPLVTLGVPVRNGEAFLSEALECLARQTYRHVEILVGDNASTDRTEEICRELAARDGRVRYLRSEVDLGAARNFNRLVAEADGAYFRWAAADDLVRPGFVEAAVEVLESRPDVVLVYPKTRLIDESGNVLEDYDDRLDLPQERSSERFRELYRRVGLCNAAYGLIRTGPLRTTGLIGPYPSSDVVLLGELALHGKFVELPERMFLRRFHRGAASSLELPDLRRHYHGQAASRPAAPLRRWRMLGENLRVVGRAPVSIGERTRVLGLVLRGCIRVRDEMVAELLEAWRSSRARSERAREVR